MTRAVEEWIGKTDDSAIPPRVRVRVFEKHNGKDYTTGRKIMPGEPWQLDHIVALINGGEHRENNLAPILVAKHKEKTARDVEEKARVAERRAKHIGIKKRSRFPGARSSPWKIKIGGGVESRDRGGR